MSPQSSFIPLKSENGVEMEIFNSEVRLNFTVGGNVRLINKDHKPVRKVENAIAVEWMIRGEEALKDFLGRISLRYNKLGKTLKERLKNDLTNIKRSAENISKINKKQRPICKDQPLKDREIIVTVKWVKGRWRPSFPAVNIVIPFKDCRRLGEKYRVSLELEDALEIGYKVLYWITSSEISEGKGLITAEGILGKIETG